MSLPNDSRNGGNSQTYISGSGQLELFLNGQFLVNGTDWLDVVADGCEATTIQIQQDLVVSDQLQFRIDTKGSVFFSSTVLPSSTLQQSYEAGRFIDVAALSGAPVVFQDTASGGGKIAIFDGNIDVTGVIDPIGLEFTTVAANPLGGNSGGYRD